MTVRDRIPSYTYVWLVCWLAVMVEARLLSLTVVALSPSEDGVTAATSSENDLYGVLRDLWLAQGP